MTLDGAMRGHAGRAWFEPGWSALRVAGDDAVAFVNNLSTADAAAVAMGRAGETLFTDVKGRVLRHALLCRHGDGLDVVVTSKQAPALRTHLDRYHIRERLELVLLERERVFVAWDTPAWGHAYPAPMLGDTAQLVLAEGPPEEEPMSVDSFHAARIACRVPLDSADIDARTLPQELNRDAALISFSKGCYLGQETVARIDALGRVNRLLVSWRAGSYRPAPGEELRVADEAIGYVTSVAATCDGGVAGLAMVRREHAAGGATLDCTGGAARVVVSPT